MCALPISNIDGRRVGNTPECFLVERLVGCSNSAFAVAAQLGNGSIQLRIDYLERVETLGVCIDPCVIEDEIVADPVCWLEPYRNSESVHMGIVGVPAGAKIFGEALSAIDVGRQPDGEHVINNRNVECALELAFVVISDLDFGIARSEEHTSELQSLMRNSYAVF